MMKTTIKKLLKTIITSVIIMFLTIPSFAQWSIDEGFEDGVIPEGWTIHDGNNDGVQWFPLENTTHAHTGTWMAAVYCSGNDGDDWLITPQATIKSGDEFIFCSRGPKV